MLSVNRLDASRYRSISICVLIMLCSVGRAAFGQTDSSQITFKPPPLAFQLGDLEIGSADVSANYSNLHQAGSGAVNAFGLSFGAMTMPYNASEGDGNYGPSIELTFGYRATDQPGNTSVENLGVTFLWNKPSVRFGPAIGFQTNPATFNYGGFGQWFASPVFDADVHLGEYSGSGPSGNFLGAAINFYALPDLALRADVTNNSVNGGNQTDLTTGVEYLVSETTPISVIGGYTYSTYPGIENIGQIFIGARMMFSGSGIATLIDRNRVGVPPPHQYRF